MNAQKNYCSFISENADKIKSVRIMTAIKNHEKVIKVKIAINDHNESFYTKIKADDTSLIYSQVVLPALNVGLRGKIHLGSADFDPNPSKQNLDLGGEVIMNLSKILT